MCIRDRCVCADLPFLTDFPATELEGPAYSILKPAYEETDHTLFWNQLGSRLRYLARPKKRLMAVSLVDMVLFSILKICLSFSFAILSIDSAMSVFVSTSFFPQNVPKMCIRDRD